jgi:hypothetical protein
LTFGGSRRAKLSRRYITNGITWYVSLIVFVYQDFIFVGAIPTASRPMFSMFVLIPTADSKMSASSYFAFRSFHKCYLHLLVSIFSTEELVMILPLFHGTFHLFRNVYPLGTTFAHKFNKVTSVPIEL